MDFAGWALFLDGDMIVREDIARLWEQRDHSKAVQVVKHDYKTKHPRKYIGSPLEADNKNYPRKNWSSVMLFNCSHPANRILTPRFVSRMSSQFLHRLEWLEDEDVGTLPARWNRLVLEQPAGDAALLHYTLGVPGFAHYAELDEAAVWHRTLLNALNIAGEDPADIVARAQQCQ